ncbi:CBS domain-containing protein [Robbsia andropogonis]|uniref:CBS domain-containing protein n=1 Tax=Robbsia andropogonis TaxID=28092 RepID=UPI003D2374EC
MRLKDILRLKNVPAADVRLNDAPAGVLRKPLPEGAADDLEVLKATALYTVSADQKLSVATDLMAEHDIGSLVVLEAGEVVGMLTFREVLKALKANGGTVGDKTVRSAMDTAFISGTMNMHIDQLRQSFLERHARYIPVIDNRMLMGVISLYDVARAVVEAQGFENQMLKAYIRDWPHEDVVSDELRI